MPRAESTAFAKGILSTQVITEQLLCRAKAELGHVIWQTNGVLRSRDTTVSQLAQSHTQLSRNRTQLSYATSNMPNLA
eukprot:1156958-Rhodomonas_salina.1